MTLGGRFQEVQKGGCWTLETDGGVKGSTSWEEQEQRGKAAAGR